MSRYKSVVLSFNSDELEGDFYSQLSFKDCEPLRKIDAWLKRRGYDPLAPFRPSLGSNAILFGGCYNKLDIDKFCKFVQKLNWGSLEDVQILYWDEEDSKFSVIGFPLA